MHHTYPQLILAILAVSDNANKVSDGDLRDVCNQYIKQWGRKRFDLMVSLVKMANPLVEPPVNPIAEPPLEVDNEQSPPMTPEASQTLLDSVGKNERRSLNARRTPFFLLPPFASAVRTAT